MAIARITQISAESKKSFADAIEVDVKRANKSLRNVTGAWVPNQEVAHSRGKITCYRVKLNVPCILDGTK